MQATEINEAMKLAAAESLALLAREDVPEEVSRAYGGRKFSFGPDYIIPSPLDPRIIEWTIARRSQGRHGKRRGPRAHCRS